MEKMAYQIRMSYVATATALTLVLPQFGDTDVSNLLPRDTCEIEPLGDASKPVCEALSWNVYTPADPNVAFSLLTEVATRLIKESKPLDRDFVAVVQKEFWNLLQ
jgi:hypothetical protein